VSRKERDVIHCTVRRIINVKSLEWNRQQTVDKPSVVAPRRPFTVGACSVQIEANPHEQV